MLWLIGVAKCFYLITKDTFYDLTSFVGNWAADVTGVESSMKLLVPAT